MSDESKKHVIAILVDNEFGALARIVELFFPRIKACLKNQTRDFKY